MSRQADRIRAEAAKLRAHLAEQGATAVDAIAQECGFLMGAIEGLTVQLENYTGKSTKAARGCQICEVNDSTGTYTVEVEYERGQRGKFSGPPEDCYPDEPSSVSIIRVLINGEWIEPSDLIAPEVLDRWADTLCAELDEAEE